MKTLLACDSAHCDDATAYFAAELWRDGRKVTFSGVFSLCASGGFLATAEGAAGGSHADYHKAQATARAQEILKTWDESYDVAKIQGVPAFVVVGKYLLNVQALGSAGAMTETIKELLVK